MKRAVCIAVSLLAAGCKISEPISTPPGEPSVIVQLVLNSAAPVQMMLLERSDGADSRAPLSGATVQLTHLRPDASCANPVVTLREVTDTLIYGLTTQVRHSYQTAGLCALHPGDQVALRIATPEGEVVTGTTRIPDASSMVIAAGPDSAGTLLLDRTRDSLRASLAPRSARGLQIEIVRKGGNPRRTASFNPPIGPAFDITTDTMHAVIAGSLADPFEGRTVFRAGVVYLFSAAATDTNYFDFVRSGDNPLTGRGFINHLTGAIGVFGSVSPRTYEVRVRAPHQDPREGIYRITGHLAAFGNANVDVTWDAYLDALSDDKGNFSALVDGTWVEGTFHSSADGTFTKGFHALFYGTPSDSLPNIRPLYLIDHAGNLPPRGTPFVAGLKRTIGNRTTSDQVTVVQQSGP